KLGNAQFTIVPKLSDGSPVPGYENGIPATGLPGNTVDVPDVSGYTKTAKTVDVPTDKPNVDVIYTPNSQKATIHFVDQSGNTIASNL
ncbi:hypothetical protein, partial [Secundilactobacillus folii]|uniref:hypothetical protein n=1 Tax=Secundilactobacillus folii TaxID=2678357 RepID=UPI0015665FF4